MKKNNKILYLEILRILAAFFVIFNHTGINGFFLFSKYGVNTITFWLGAFFSIFCKFSVPMFFGISGILLLNKEESIKDIWKNRILKIFITLILISTLFYCYDVFYAKTETFNLITYIKKLYTNGNNIVLWYLYGYMAFLICLPFLRSIVKHLEDKHYYYLILIAILFNGIVPIIEWLFFKGKVTLYYKMYPTWIISELFIYPLIGYFMHYKYKFKNVKKELSLLWISNIILIFLCCFMIYYKGEIDGDILEANSQAFHYSFVIVNFITIFLTIKHFFNNKEIKPLLSKIIYSLGECTFGIYLIHVLVKNFTFKIYIFIDSILRIKLLTSFLWVFVIMMASYIIVYILKKVPILKKYI